MRFITVFILSTVVLTIALMPTASAELADGGYRLGSGYPVGETGLRLGGYASVQFDAPRTSSWQFSTRDISLFLAWDNGSRLRFFSELEGGSVFTSNEHRLLDTRNARFEFERFYFDELINDKLTVRLGKFLTPIGRWNLIHAAPLVWTSNRPVATENLFSTHASGLMLHGSVSVAQRQLEYAVYGDLSNSIDPHHSKNPFDNAVGARLGYAIDDTLQVGASFANYVMKDLGAERYYLAGLDIAWTYQKFEVSSEVVCHANDNADTDSAWQGFVQGVSPIIPHWFAVGRYEFFEQAQNNTGQVGVLGLAYRPLPPLVWKLEYRMGAHNEALAPDGLSASFAILF